MENKMPYCPNCGTEVQEGAKFCPECGKSTKPEQPVPEQHSTPESIQTTPVPQPPPAPIRPTPKEKPKKKRTLLIVLLIAVAVVLLICCVSVLLYKPSPEVVARMTATKSAKQTEEAKPTNTPGPTATPTNTPLPTDTPLPTNTPTTAPTPLPTSTATVTPTPIPLPKGSATAGVNLRKGPGTNYEKVGSLVEGEKVEILGATSNGDWYRIKTGTGDMAWVAAVYISTDTQPETIPIVATSTMSKVMYFCGYDRCKDSGDYGNLILETGINVWNNHDPDRGGAHHQAANGDKVTVIEEKRISEGPGGLWYKLQGGGWTNDYWLTEEKCTKDNVPEYSFTDCYGGKY